MKKVAKWLVLAIARCNDCEWDDWDYKTSQATARKHALKTGHEVVIETGYVQYYNKKKKEE